MCDKYLLLQHQEALINILTDIQEEKHFSITIDFLELFEHAQDLCLKILKDAEHALEVWNQSAIQAQQALIEEHPARGFLLKRHVHCRFHSLHTCADLQRTTIPRCEDLYKFLQFRGVVVRKTVTKLLEYERQYTCTKCKYVMIVQADYAQRNKLIAPKCCMNPSSCKGTSIIANDLVPDLCKDYQEIKVQEVLSQSDSRSIPSFIWVILEDDLIDSCQPGDNINVSGVVLRRFGELVVGKKIEVELIIKANHLDVNNNHMNINVTNSLKNMLQGFWKTYADKPLVARDIIVKSICPKLFGLHLVKLATAVVLAGGSRTPDNLNNTGISTRSEPHLLLVGDPGTGKSQILKFAAKIIPRSVVTTGVGSTAAGLTATAVIENGEWQLEGGALVQADGGICCIDEFSTMKEHDRTSIHEAMEQQSISVAKAGIVSKLKTRCSILAATNPKGTFNPNQDLTMNVAIASPLLSRFDLILLIRDKINDNYDKLVTEFICNLQFGKSKFEQNLHWTVDTLQGYFAIIKTLNPVLTEDSKRILDEYYQAQRRKSGRNKSRTTVRLLDSLVRLSQGHARLMYRSNVEILDAVIAVMLVDISMEAEYSVFNLNADTRGDFPNDPMDAYKELVAVILKKLCLEDLLDYCNTPKTVVDDGSTTQTGHVGEWSNRNNSKELGDEGTNVKEIESNTQYANTSKKISGEILKSKAVTDSEGECTENPKKFEVKENINDKHLVKKGDKIAKPVIKDCSTKINLPVESSKDLPILGHNLGKGDTVENLNELESVDDSIRKKRLGEDISTVHKKLKTDKRAVKVPSDLEVLKSIPSCHEIFPDNTDWNPILDDEDIKHDKPALMEPQMTKEPKTKFKFVKNNVGNCENLSNWNDVSFKEFCNQPQSTQKSPPKQVIASSSVFETDEDIDFDLDL